MTTAGPPVGREAGRRASRPAVALALAMLAAASLAGCVAPSAGSAGAGAAASAYADAAPEAAPAAIPAASPIPVATPIDPALIQPIVVSTSLWPGRDTLLLALEDASNAPLGGPGVAVRVLVGDGAAAQETGSSLLADGGAEARYVRLSADGRGLYEVAVDLPPAGRVPVAVVATAGGRTWHGETAVDVLDPGRTPAIGSKAPAVGTPTSGSVGGDLARVTTDPIPDRRLYWLSVRDAIEARSAFVLVLDSFAFRTSPSCGGALGIVHHLVDEFPTVSFIHAEPYATTWAGGSLELDAPGGAPRPAAWSAAWGVSEAPWVFVVDRDGVIRAKFSGVVGTDELRAAIRSVVDWAPTY